MDTSRSPRPGPGDAAGIYLLAAHPDWRASRVNRRAREAVRGLAGVHLCDLYEKYPDYEIDVPAEQRLLEAARLIVLMHPIQWYSMPALQKLWMDEVLQHGWAYGANGHALRGKDLWLVATTGGTSESYHPGGYNRHFFDAFIPAYEQTATLCGMRFLPPMLLHGAHRVSEPELQSHVDTLRDRLANYPDWPELEGLGECVACEVPQRDRKTDVADATTLSD